MPRAVARLKYPINYPHDVAKLRLEYDTPAPVTVDVDAIRRFEEGRIIYESPLIDYHSYLRLIQPIVRDGLVGEWLFFEGAGDVLHDTSGQGNHGTIYGMTWQQLETGKWVGYFDGVDDYVWVPYSASLDFGGVTNLTVEKICKLNKKGVEQYSGREKQFLIGYDSYDDSWAFWLHIGGGWRGLRDLPKTFTPEIGRWVHLVGVYDGSKIRLYVNGVVDRERTQAGGLDDVDTGLAIGRRGGEALNFWNGAIALVRIYNRVLSPDEIQQLYELAKLIVPLG